MLEIADIGSDQCAVVDPRDRGDLPVDKTRRQPDLPQAGSFGRVPRGSALHEAVVQTFVAARSRGGMLKEVVVVDLTEAREFLRNARSEGLAPLVRQFERRLSRSLTDPERATLVERLVTAGPDRLGDVVLDLDTPSLAAWLADPDAR